MPEWESQDPEAWGWKRGAYADVEPFNYRGYAFPQGVAAGTGRIWDEALLRLTRAGLALPPSIKPDRSGMWGLANRKKTSGNGWSFHAYGLAIDVCAPWNPSGVKKPPATAYRLPEHTGGLVQDLGLAWGGNFREVPDWMHLELHLRPDEVAGVVARIRTGQDDHPYPLPAGHYFGPYAGGSAKAVSGGYVAIPGAWRAALIEAQARLRVAADGIYGPVTKAAVTAFQRRAGLVPDGLIGPLTWAALFRA